MESFRSKGSCAQPRGAGIGAGQVERVGQQPVQRPARASDHLQHFALARIELGVRQGVGQADHPVQRGADLVAHIGQELALGQGGGVGAGAGAQRAVLGSLAEQQPHALQRAPSPPAGGQDGEEQGGDEQLHPLHTVKRASPPRPASPE